MATKEQITAELYRKAQLGIKPTSSANMAEYNKIVADMNAKKAADAAAAQKAQAAQVAAARTGVQAGGTTTKTPVTNPAPAATNPYTNPYTGAGVPGNVYTNPAPVVNNNPVKFDNIQTGPTVTPGSGVGTGTGAGQFTKNADGSISGQLTPQQLATLQSLPDAQKSAFLQSIMGNATAGAQTGGGGVKLTKQIAPDVLEWYNKKYGGIDKYVTNNVGRYQRGEITYEQLLADSQRVGYDITGINPPEAPKPEKTLEEIIAEQFAALFGGGLMQDTGALWQQANGLGQKAYDESKANFERLINSLQTNQEADLNSIQADVYGNKQDLEDRGFQDYLKARQMMADRGLAGTGLASDQDTRLLLDRGRQMARINQDAMAKGQKVRAEYGSRLSEAQAQLAGLNLTDMQAKFFKDLYDSGNKALMDKADLFLKALQGQQDFRLGAGELQFKYDQLDTQTRQAYDKMTSDEKIAFGKMDNENQQLAAKLSQEYNIEMSKIMGVGPNGQPTLDAMKLAEQIRSNQAGEFLRGEELIQRASENAAKLEQDMNQFNAKIALQADQLKNTQWATQGGNLKAMITSKGQTITSLTNMLKGMDAKDPLRAGMKDQLDKAIQEHYSLTRALDDLTFGKLPGQSGSTSANSGTNFWTQLFGWAKKNLTGGGSSNNGSGGGGGAAYNPK